MFWIAENFKVQFLNQNTYSSQFFIIKSDQEAVIVTRMGGKNFQKGKLLANVDKDYVLLYLN